MVIVTLSVGVIIQNALLAIGGATFFTYQFNVGATLHPLGFDAERPHSSMIMGLAVAAMVVVQLLLTQTRLGKAMRATAANPGLAQASGIATDRVVDAAWFISGSALRPGRASCSCSTRPPSRAPPAATSWS